MSLPVNHHPWMWYHVTSPVIASLGSGRSHFRLHLHCFCDREKGPSFSERRPFRCLSPTPTLLLPHRVPILESAARDCAASVELWLGLESGSGRWEKERGPAVMPFRPPQTTCDWPPPWEGWRHPRAWAAILSVAFPVGAAARSAHHQAAAAISVPAEISSYVRQKTL